MLSYKVHFNYNDRHNTLYKFIHDSWPWPSFQGQSISFRTQNYIDMIYLLITKELKISRSNWGHYVYFRLQLSVWSNYKANFYHVWQFSALLFAQKLPIYQRCCWKPGQVNLTLAHLICLFKNKLWLKLKINSIVLIQSHESTWICCEPWIRNQPFEKSLTL
jgi:hypothetical protein